jgi:putative DNA primase/helicase
LVKCFSGCTQREVIAALERKGLWPRSKREKSSSIQRATKDPGAADANGSDSLNTAISLRRQANYRKRRTVERYLRGRSIVLELPKGVGEVSATRLRDLGYSANVPGMLVPIYDSQLLNNSERRPRLIGVQLTLLKQMANNKIVRDMRRNFGKTGGGVVQFGGRPEDVLLIAEGVETALSVFEAIGASTWAALSAGNMASITIPPQVQVVVVCADNDDPGLKAGTALAERVAKMGKTALLAVPEHQGDDFNDVLIHSGADAISDAIRNTQEIEAPETSSVRLITAGDLLNRDFPPRRNILAPWLPWQGLAMIHAQRGTGKTWVAFGVMCAVAAGGEFLGWTADACTDVLYLDGELPGNLLQQRYAEFRRTFGAAIDERISFVRPDLQDAGMPDLSTPSGQAQIDELITPSTGLIIIDSKATLCRTGLENDAESWRPVQSWMLKHRAAGKSILLIHHSGKSGLQRGTSAIEDVLDTVIGLRHTDDYSAENGAEFDVVFEKTRNFFGSDAASFHAKIETENGPVSWTLSGDKQTERLEEIAKMVTDGIGRKEIADHFGISTSRIAQLVKQARRKGLIDDEAA